MLDSKFVLVITWIVVWARFSERPFKQLSKLFFQVLRYHGPQVHSDKLMAVLPNLTK